MAIKTFDGVTVRVGAPWFMDLALVSSEDGTPQNVFLAGRTFAGKCWPGGAAPLITTATVTRVSDNICRVSLTPVQTALFAGLTFRKSADGFGEANVLIDLIRTDTDPDEPLDISLTLTVVQQAS